MLKIESLKVSYGNHIVLNDLNLDVAPWTIHGLVGLNGSGKTTLLNTIYGLKKASHGSIQYMSQDIGKGKIAYLETINYFYPRITGLEYLSLFQTHNEKFNIEEWNGLFELPLKELVDNYSSGMKKKLALMGIICLDREIMILDEPYNGLDMETVQKFKTLLLRLRSKKTILITSHILETLLKICDAISYLNDGKIEFTKEKGSFSTIENEIFSVHQNNIDRKIDELIGR